MLNFAVMETSYWKIFSGFAKIGAFTIGGGYAMIPIIEKELVNNKKWITEEEFMDIIAIAQSAPGLISVNVAVFMGHKLRGTPGSVAAALGCILPSFLIILLIAMFFTGYENNPVIIRIFKGIRPIVVALIAIPMVNMAVKSRLNLLTGSIALATAILIAVLKVSPVYILLVTGTIYASITVYKNKKGKK